MGNSICRITRSQVLKGLTCYVRRCQFYLTGKESCSRFLRWRMTCSHLCFKIPISGDCGRKIHDGSGRDPSQGSGNGVAEEMRRTWIKAGEVRMKRGWAQEKFRSGRIRLVTNYWGQGGTKSYCEQEYQGLLSWDMDHRSQSKMKVLIFFFFQGVFCK